MTTTLRIDDGLKSDCDRVFEDLGLNMTSAITLFLKQVVRTRGIPFAISSMPYVVNDRIEEKLAEARRDVQDGRVLPLRDSISRMRCKFNVHA